ncbi:MAG: amidohydrolase family protein [Planctomycetota bacterium]
MSAPATRLKPIRSAGTAANLLGLDYLAEAVAMGPPPTPMIDVHSHINGRHAARLYAGVAESFGVGLTYTMTQLEQMEAIRGVLGNRVRFIAVPNYFAEDRRHHLGRGFLERIEAFHAAGSRIVKFWAAPRAIDYGEEWGDPTFMRLDAPHRIESMELASDLGMCFMTHIADPDTWFQSRYADARRYGTKAQQYEQLEILLDRFTRPWIAAHMGGWPEDLEFLTGLLERHANLYLDTSATKWMVRELSRHSRQELVTFLARFRGRVLFGSDIVTSDEHLEPRDESGDGIGQGGPAEATELYASRYWALRTLLETRYVGPSPIADPDLSMVDPQRWGPLDAPPLIGKALPGDLLSSVYHDAAHALLDPLHS